MCFRLLRYKQTDENTSVNVFGGETMNSVPVNERLAISVPEAAALLGVSPPTAYELTHRADFPAVKVGGRTIIYRKGLEDWLARQAEAKEA